MTTADDDYRVTTSAAAAAVVDDDGAPEEEQRLYENVEMLKRTDVSSSDAIITAAAAVTDLRALDVVETTASKHVQASSSSSKSSKKLTNWSVLRFSRPKSKNSKTSAAPPPPPPSMPRSSSPLPSSPLPSPPPSPLRSPSPVEPIDVDNMPVLANMPLMANDLDMFQFPPCVCTRYRRTTDDYNMDDNMDFEGAAANNVRIVDDDDENDERSARDAFDFEGTFDAFRNFNAFNHHSQLVLPSFDEGMMDLHIDMREDIEDRAYKERAKEMQEGIEPPPGFRPGLQIQLLEFNLPKMTLDNLTSLFHRAAISAFNAPHDADDEDSGSHRIHTSIDYIHYLVPDLLQITNCSFYWGKMDRYEAERLLENKPEGTFLLRDSAQEEYLFSVSFRKYGRSLHARIEQWNHMFSFDSRDPGVFASSTVCGLIEHYKDPTCCMFFEPMLTIPLNRNFTFSLQHTCRATICNQITYDDVNQLKIPKMLKSYMKEYHYKQRVRVRIFDAEI